ncbi:unnamed protein product, partial [Anisakis simplex]|uniref:Reductive dehalogenase subunit A n=1 Tax=Anisakis simplex TaxID=6269 RepID=A0A0M3K2S3_ANISI
QYEIPNADPVHRKVKLPDADPLYRTYRQCIADGLYSASAEAIWGKVTDLVNDCMKKHNILKRFPLRQVRNSDETKYFLNVTSNIPASEQCNVVTLGIGKDIAAEQQLAKLIPAQCHFHGADPGINENKQLYSTIGTYYPYAIAATSGIKSASLYGMWHPENILTQ